MRGLGTFYILQTHFLFYLFVEIACNQNIRTFISGKVSHNSPFNYKKWSCYMCDIVFIAEVFSNKMTLHTGSFIDSYTILKCLLLTYRELSNSAHKWQQLLVDFLAIAVPTF